MTKNPKYSKTQKGCHVDKSIETIQPFPKSDPLKSNFGPGLADLRKRLLQSSGRTYSYIVQSVKMNNDSNEFEQLGSAPNFQGGRLTLCTCKHQMRTRRSPNEWEGTWVAGFTSRTIHDSKNWLFYLAKIDKAYESQCDIWNGVNPETREAKAAHLNYLGDLFMPMEPHLVGRAKFSPTRYQIPVVHSHRNQSNPDGWKKDINYVHSKTHRQPSLLAGDPELTFIWDEPTIYLPGKHCRDYAKWFSIGELLSQLKKVR